MQALMFDTKILQNGIIQIPALSDWKDYEVSIIIVKKSRRKKIHSDKKETLTYNSKKILADFHRIRQMKTGQAEILTMDKAINIYDELTNIH